MTTENKRLELGEAALSEITGGTGTTVVESLKDIAPDLAEWIISFSYGDVMASPGLDKRSRQFATVAALTAMGTAMRRFDYELIKLERRTNVRLCLKQGQPSRCYRSQSVSKGDELRL